MNRKEYVLMCLEDYMSEFCKEPRRGLPARRYSFELASYNRATIKEIMRAISESNLPPIIVVEDFVDKMDSFACKAKTTKAKQIFSIAYDMAVNIEDFMRSLK